MTSENHSIWVCRSCHGSLKSVAVRTTGEFSASDIALALSPTIQDPAEPHAGPTAIRCTFCSKLPEQVKKLFSHGGAHICNECIALCSDILTSELGEGWAKLK